MAGQTSEDVEAVLTEIGVKRDDGRRILEVWNKVDLVGADLREDLDEQAVRHEAVAVSAVTGDGVEALLDRLTTLIDDNPERTFRLSVDDGEALAWLYRHGRVTGRREATGGLEVTARLDAQALGRFERMRPRLEAHPAAG